MLVVQIEHPVASFDTWKAAFDGDPVRRQASGVRRYRVFRPIDDPLFVAVDLEFDDREAAIAFKRALEMMWQTPQAGRAMGDGAIPRARIVSVVETHSYVGRAQAGS